MAEMKLDRICRTCMCEKAALSPLFGANVANMLMTCTAIQVVQGDGLPDNICSQCILTVSKAYTFKQMCEKSDNALRSYIGSISYQNVSLQQAQDSIFNSSDVLQQAAIFSDIFTDDHGQALVENFTSDNTVVTDLAETMQSLQTIAEQCLPATWDTEPNLMQLHSSSDEACDGFGLAQLYKCQFCEELFKDEWTLGEHTKIHMKFYCNYCGNISLTQDEFDKHMVLHRNTTNVTENLPKLPELHTCTICNNAYTDAKSLKKHTKEAHPVELASEKSYVCNTCGNSYRQNKLLVMHMRTHTGERPLSCDICGKTFALPSSLHKHKAIHTGQKKHHCRVCEKSFSQASNLTVHMRSHTGEKPYICTVCGRGCMTSVNLTIHMRIHTNERPYKCQSCEASFPTNSQLRKHNLIHTGERPYKCWHCGKAFRQKDTRDTHVRYHTGDRPYACTLCPKKYIAANHLRVHMKVHSNDRKHECHICLKRFVEAKTLKTHLLTHSGDKPHVCKFCGASFSQSGSLHSHLKTRHQVIPPAAINA